MAGDDSGVVEWAESGAMALTGYSDGPPLVAPARIAAAARAAAAEFTTWSARWGERVEVDGPALLGERAAIAGLTRQGSVSVGGAARFVRAADGFVVLNLPRPDDVAALPALIESAIEPDDWTAIAGRLEVMASSEIIERATLLGVAASIPHSVGRPVRPVRELHRGGTREVSARPLVVDLTSLWAGPLLTSLLADAGARVIKVEGVGRPDGARRGPREFFDLLNHRKEAIAIDFTIREGRNLLAALLHSADLVVEGSRPRAMEQLGIDPGAVADTGTSWLSITGYGRTGPDARRIGFGDDAAVAGGLVIDGDPPLFVADAVADPLTGLAGAAAAADLLGSDRAGVVEVPLSRVAAWASGEPATAELKHTPVGWQVVVDGERAPVHPPRARPSRSAAASADQHGSAVSAEFGGGAISSSH